MNQIVATVTNDLVHDRRMDRICTSLQGAGYAVTLVGRCYRDSPPLSSKPYSQKRLSFLFRKGKLFYLEYQVRLFWYLLWVKADVFCAVDLDTILPVTVVGKMRGKKLIYDAHEYFTEVPELEGRPWVKKVWELVARMCIPQMHSCYTVGPALAEILSQRYYRTFAVIRNIPPVPKQSLEVPSLDHKALWYHGALNKGRGLEELLDVVQWLPGYDLYLAGEGDLSDDLRASVKARALDERVHFLGWVAPENLWAKMASSSIGFNLLDSKSKSYYYSLANKAFDYIQVGLPSIQMVFPEYQYLSRKGSMGVLVEDLNRNTLINAIQTLIDPLYYPICQKYLLSLRDDLSWEREEKVLIRLYQQVLPTSEQG